MIGKYDEKVENMISCTQLHHTFMWMLHHRKDTILWNG